MRKLGVLILFICLFPISVNAINMRDEFYVNDDSNILTEQSINYLFDKSSKLTEVDDIKIIVHTIDSLNGEDISIYSDKFLLDLELVENQIDNCILLLFVEDVETLRVDVGGELEEILTFNKVKKFTEDYVNYNIEDKKYDEAIINGFNAIYKELIVTKNLSLEYVNPIKDSEEVNSISTTEIGVMIIFAVILFFLGKFSNLYKKNKSKYNVLFIILSSILIIINLFLSIYSFLLCLGVYLFSLLINRNIRYTGKISLFKKNDNEE